MPTPPTPPTPEPGFKHLNGGTRREPQIGEHYMNERRILEGLEPFTQWTHPTMTYVPLDSEIPYKERWIMEAE